MPSLPNLVKRHAGLLAALAGLAFVLLFMEPTPWEIRVGGLSIDQAAADLFWNPRTGQWAVDNRAQPWAFLFYSGAKLALALAAGLAALVALAPSRFDAALRARFPALPTRRSLVFFVLAMAVIPTVCNRGKAVTNIYCPYEHTRYNGYAPYVRLWDEYPAAFKAKQAADPRERGRGFPAGHASGGFALMALGWVMRRRWLGILIGTLAGWAMGGYQMVKGAHYLSHTLTTWCLAWLMLVALAAVVKPRGGRAVTPPAA